MKAMYPNKKLTELWRQATGKLIIIEVNVGQELDLKLLSQIQPSFCSITWIGNFKESPENIPPIRLSKVLIEEGHNVILHVPCRNLTKERALDVLNTAKKYGVRNIFAIQGQSKYIEERDDSKVDFPYASHFVDFIREQFKDTFDIGVAGYPKKHPSSANTTDDLAYLKSKVSSGATFVIAQGCLKFEEFATFLDNCKNASINVPIFMGLFIIRSFKNFIFIKDLIKSSEVIPYIIQHKDDDDRILQFGKNTATDLIRKSNSCSKMVAGVDIFSMNKFDLIADVLLSSNK